MNYHLKELLYDECTEVLFLCLLTICWEKTIILVSNLTNIIWRNHREAGTYPQLGRA